MSNVVPLACKPSTGIGVRLQMRKTKAKHSHLIYQQCTGVLRHSRRPTAVGGTSRLQLPTGRSPSLPTDGHCSDAKEKPRVTCAKKNNQNHRFREKPTRDIKSQVNSNINCCHCFQLLWDCPACARI